MSRRQLMVSAALLIFVSCGLTARAAQEGQQSAGTEKLKAAWVLLGKNPSDPGLQKQYLAAFPQDYKTFLDFFGSQRPLYDEAGDYIGLLPQLARYQDAAVGALLVRLDVDARYAADAPSYLQYATAVFGSHYTERFDKLVKVLSAANRAQIAAFLADVEDPESYPEYQKIIDQLKALGDSNLAHEFESAREKRKAQPHG